MLATVRQTKIAGLGSFQMLVSTLAMIIGQTEPLYRNIKPVVYSLSLFTFLFLLYIFTAGQWKAFEMDSRYAVTTAVEDQHFVFIDKKLARRYVYENPQMVLQSDTRWNSIIDLLIFYHWQYENKSEVLDIIRLLATNAADINAAGDGSPVLYSAIHFNQPSVVSVLLEAGADVNGIYKTDTAYCPEATAIDYALCLRRINFGNRHEIISLLLAHEES